MTARLVREIPDLEPWHGATVVPTMGALHDGHLALVRTAVARGGPVLVTIFVNPTQFDEAGDLDRYPRRLDEDVRAVTRAGADAVFAPEVATVYPPATDVAVPPLPEVATRPGLEDARRPGHFAGVCQVVARLFDLTRPRRAVFGEKDYQQLLVVTRMVSDAGSRWPDLEIVPVATVRDPDGLALSSRNTHLPDDARDRARGLWRALAAAPAAATPSAAETRMRDVLAAHGLAIEYAVVRDARTLLPAEDLEVPTRALIAARLGGVRLIDNGPMTA